MFSEFQEISWKSLFRNRIEVTKLVHRMFTENSLTKIEMNKIKEFLFVDEDQCHQYLFLK